MVTVILDVLAEYDLDVNNCRDQAHVDAINMLGI